MNKIRILSASLCFIVLTACHDHSSHDHGEDGHNHEVAVKDDHDDHDDHDHGDAIILSPDKAKAAGVEIRKIEPVEFSGVIPVSGKVLPASGEETTVAATVAGIVRLRRPMIEGASVGKGTALFSISTSDLADGDVSQRARVAYTSAKAEYERATKLLESKLISEKDFNSIKTDFENARLSYQAVGGGNGGITISAPSSGYVKEYMVKDGDFVNVGQPMMTISQNRHLYLRAEVPEKNYPMLGRVVSAKFKTTYDDNIYDLRNHNGRILSYGKSTGGSSSFVPVTFEFNNCSGVIPGSYARVYLITSSKKNVIAVPETALTEEQGLYFVYIREDDECYRKQEVRLGDTDGEMTEIISGLNPGDDVVVKGAIHVKLASAEKSIPGHTHNH